MKQALREMTFDDVLNDTPESECPVVFTGEMSQCSQFAEERGYVWKDSPRKLFGGFWYLKPVKGVHTGSVLLPDRVPQEAMAS